MGGICYRPNLSLVPSPVYGCPALLVTLSYPVSCCCPLSRCLTPDLLPSLK